MKIIAAIAAILLLSAAAQADTIYVGAWSKHLVDGDYNENHELLAVERDQWMGGTFVNSYGDRSYLVGHGWDLARLDHLNFRVYAGATYGYNQCYGDKDGERARVCPALVPEISYTRYRLQPAVILFAEAVALTFKFEF